MSMAGVSSKFVDVEALKERFLECDICKEIFDEENHHPRLLPCLHTLCNDCIVKLVADEKIRCPKCQKFHSVPGNCIETFKKDNTRRDLLDFVNVQKEPSSLQCESCDKKLPAKFRCKDCSEFLCTECYSYHVHNKKFKTHYVFSIDSIEFKKEQLENFKHESSCSIPEHSDALKFYCAKSSCKKPICTTCAIAEHKESNGHIVRDILDVYSQEKAQMELKKATLEEKKETALAIVKSIEQEENDLHQHGKTAKENIKAQFETCFKILERRRDQLLEDVDVTVTRKNKVLEVHRQELESFNELITDAVSFYDQSLLYKNYPAFLEIVRTIEDRFKYLIDQKIDPVPHENACVEFTPTCMGMEFQTYANTTGKVYHTSVYPPNTMIEIQQLENQEREILISVTFRDESGNKITDLDTMPFVIVKINSAKEPMESIEIPCDLSDAGRYKAVTKGLSPGKYKIETIMFKKCFGADVKEVEYKEDEHKTTVEDGKAKDLLTTPMAEHKTTTEDGKAKDHLTTPITEQEKIDEDGKPKDQLPLQIAERTPGDVMSFTFDPLTLHKKRYISDDCLTISNVKQEDTHAQMNEGKALKVYGGVRGSAPITYPEKCIIEVEIKYKIIENLTERNLVFEIGFIKEEEIDTHHHCQSLSIQAAQCKSCQMVCLFMYAGNDIIKHISISNTTEDTSYTGTFTVFINSKKGEIEVFDEQHVRIYLFTDVAFRNELWPMFGVYNNPAVHTRLRLIKAIKGKDLKLNE